ncbi:minor capsid protein [Ruegeria phage RpAliso]|nr:minor capsid protein [Ruegeria phage RpAliso]
MARSEVNIIFDAEAAFRAPGSAPVTASGEIGTFKLDKLVNVRPSSQRNKLGAQGYKIAIVVEELATAGADEVYTFDVAVGATGAAATKVAEVTVVEAGQYVIALDAQTIEHLDADREELALNLTVAGAAPSVTFSAWVV